MCETYSETIEYNEISFEIRNSISTFINLYYLKKKEK